ncbi:hypothetical protein KR018_000946 [Drosophila ironensis]|nr:hypothetical protein KR018_000946 [Drosophila ironensis]
MLYTNAVRFLSLTVGCLYPAFASYKILNGPRRSDEDMRMWMSYWIVYGVFLIFDFLSSGLVLFVPFLNEIKLIFLFWLLPTLGAGNQVIYEEFLRSFFNSNEKSIEQALNHATLTGGDFFSQMIGSVLGQMMSLADSCLLMHGRRLPIPITPSVEDIVNNVIAERRLERIQKDSQPSTVDGEPTEEEQEEDENADPETGAVTPVSKSKETDISLGLMLENVTANVMKFDSQVKKRPLTPPKPKRQPLLPVDGDADLTM